MQINWRCVSPEREVRSVTANTKKSYNICTASAQRLRRWSNIVKMLYKCFVFAGYVGLHVPCHCLACPTGFTAMFVLLQARFHTFHGMGCMCLIKTDNNPAFQLAYPFNSRSRLYSFFLIFISTLNTCKETWPFINQQDFKIADLHFVKSEWLRLRLRLQLKQHAVYFSDGYLTTSRYYKLYIKNFEIRLLVVFIFKKKSHQHVTHKCRV